MESSLQGSPDVDPKAEFRKPSGDSANRNYRRRSPVGGSPSLSDGSPRRKRSSSPVSRRDSAKISDDRPRKVDRRELDRDYGKSCYERRDKYAEDIKRDSSKFGSRSDRDSRGRANSDYPKRETERRSRDNPRDSDRYSQDKSDGSGYRNRDKDRDISYAGNQKYKDRDACDRVSSGRRRTSSRTEVVKESDRDWRKEDRGFRDSKLDSRRGPDAEKSPDRKDDKQPSSSNEIPEKASVTDADIDAAKLAAVRAAELVNKNLVGTGYMSTEQKKKLLWGSKKNTPVEEAAHRWDSSIFADREKQEKFNKLMSLRLLWCLWPIVGCEGRHQSREQARYQRCREGENSVGLGEAIHCRTSKKGWSHCWLGSLRVYKGSWICESAKRVGWYNSCNMIWFLRVLHFLSECDISSYICYHMKMVCMYVYYILRISPLLAVFGCIRRGVLNCSLTFTCGFWLFSIA